MKRVCAMAMAVGILALLTPTASALQILGPDDAVIAIDLDYTTGSNTPGTEGPDRLLDGLPGTKYLNFAKTHTGFIVTPSTLAALQSFTLTTANDAEERDPASYELWGTNDPITSVPHGDGESENWIPISSGELSLPSVRQTLGPVVGFSNETAYSSYRMIFPTVKNEADANSMQVADVAFYSSMDGSGSNMLGSGDFIIPIRLVEQTPSSNSPEAEGAGNAIDNNVNTKYLNFGKERSGMIVTPSIGPTQVDSFQIVTANDWNERDPASWELHGTNDPITTENNGIGTEENWTLIDSGTMELPTDRFTAGDIITVNNNAGEFASYRLVFPTLRDAEATNSMQIAEVRMFAADPATLVVDRQTGEVMIRADETFTFAGYEISSASTEGLIEANWNSIAATNGDGDDAWEVLSDPDSASLFAEGDIAGVGADNGITLTAGNTISLGNIWHLLPSDYEDLEITLYGVDGERIADGVEFTGTDIPLGDYSGNGTVGTEDWEMFRAGLGGNVQGLSLANAYLGGDLDGDGDSDIFDFHNFVDLAGGQAALFGTSAVPEPSAFVLVLGLAAAGMGVRRWRAPRRRVGKVGVAATVLLMASLLVAAQSGPVLAQSFTNVGGVPTGISTPDPIENEDSGPEALFEDEWLEVPGNIDSELFDLVYTDFEGYNQYAGQGAEPKTVFLDYGSPVTANWFAYAQRSGADPTADRVGRFEFWFSNSDFGGQLPATEPDAVMQLDPSDARLQDSALRPYTLGGEHTGRYVGIRIHVSELSANQPVNNIGGHEFRLLSGPSDVVLEVDRATGGMVLMNNGPNADSIEMKAFTIDSASGGLDASGFNGLGGDVGAFPVGNGTGNGWELGGANNANRLIETYFDGSSTLADGQTALDLGTAYNPLSLAEDVTFRWTNSDGNMFDGVVRYVGTAPDILLGDYNDDGMVDAADYTVWRNNLGSDTALPNDATPGVVDADDYTRWKDNFGNTGSGALALSTSAVPEPGTIVLSLLATAVGATAIRRRRR